MILAPDGISFNPDEIPEIADFHHANYNPPASQTGGTAVPPGPEICVLNPRTDMDGDCSVGISDLLIMIMHRLEDTTY